MHIADFDTVFIWQYYINDVIFKKRPEEKTKFDY